MMKKRILAIFISAVLLMALIIPCYAGVVKSAKASSAAVQVQQLAAEEEEEVATAAATADDEGSAPKGDKNLVKSILISLGIGIVIGIIVVFVIKGKYKPVKLQRDASNYLVNGSLQVTGSYENFVRKTVDKREKPKNNNNN